MSKFDKILTRRAMMNDREFCSQPHFIGYKMNEETGEPELNEKGNKIPLFDQCGRKMKPHKMKYSVRWKCTRRHCGGECDIPKTEYNKFGVSVYDKKNK